jgi:hypothetical protein
MLGLVLEMMLQGHMRKSLLVLSRDIAQMGAIALGMWFAGARARRPLYQEARRAEFFGSEHLSDAAGCVDAGMAGNCRQLLIAL